MTSETKNKSRVAKWRSYAIQALLFVVVIAGIRTWQQRDMPSGMAPALQGNTLLDPSYQLPLYPEHPILVQFWATWCPVCKAEQSSIAEIAHDNPNVITVAMSSGRPEEVARHMKDQNIDFPVLNDPDGSLSDKWGVHAVPTSFVIAPNGEIRFVEVGYTTAVGLRLRLWLAGFI
jgi:thiol-disulfide isomerase/thioredoxin